jgi:trk system potassium uptake protein TrkH
MNHRRVINQLGLLLIVFSAALGVLALIAWLVDLAEHEPVDLSAEESLVVSGLSCLVVGGLMWWRSRRADPHLGRREALLLVALSWVCGALFAALPFFVWAQVLGNAPGDHPFRGFVNCYFESMSGLTTTGATVLSDIESVPRELLMWRAFTHWIGGLGIVVLFVAVLPSLGVGGKKLFHVEAPGPAPSGLQPRIRETARILWYIYLGLTTLQIVALWTAGGMHLFDATCHAFSTLATGGFSTRNASVGAYYDTAAVDVIVIVFMVLAGANFGLFYQLWRGRVRAVWRDTELRVYLLMLAIGTIIVVAAVASSRAPLVLTDGRAIEPTVGESLRQGLFTTVSIQTTTGFATADFDRWPFVAHAVLIALMFVGGCSGSTAGGIKVVRVWLAFKLLFKQVERYYRPHVTRPVRIGKATVDPALQLSTVMYVLGTLVLFLAGWAVIMVVEQANPDSTCSVTTAATASVATLCTIGPGLDGVGAVQNYGWFSAPSKVVMCVLMALGRLEIFAVLVLFTPGFWRTP